MKIKFKKEVLPEIGEQKYVKKFLFLPVFAIDKDNCYIFWLENAMITREYYAYEWRDVKINDIWIDSSWNQVANRI